MKYKSSTSKEMTPPVPLEKYRRLVAQSAWKAWRCLPQHIRVWISIEDMIEDGMFWACRWSIKHYDKNRGLSFTTGLTHGLHNFYIRMYISWYGAQQRGWEPRIIEVEKIVKGKVKIVKERKLFPMPVYSLDAMEAGLREKNNSSYDIAGEIPALVTGTDAIMQNAFTECFVVPSLISVYEQASDNLKGEFINWFWQKSKTHKHGNRFDKLAGEFRELCATQHIYYDDCIHLVRSPECLNSLSMKLFWLPYDHKCTPVVGESVVLN